MTSHKHKIEDEPAFVLHSYPFSETSLILDVFSRGHGRLPIMARGARRPKSSLRGVLMNFQPLQLSWFGKGEVRTLHSAEWQGGQPYLQGTALMCGFYLNELLLNLLARVLQRHALEQRGEFLTDQRGQGFRKNLAWPLPGLL